MIMRKLILLFSVIFLTFTFTNCTTTKGTLFSKIAASETEHTKGKVIEEEPSKTEESIKENTSTEEKGLKIITHPDNADIYINDNYMGKSPLLISNLERGTYKITIEREGYYTKIVWLDYNGTSLIYETDLKQIVGFLSIHVTPSNSTIIVGDQLITEGLKQLPVGTYQVSVRSFGYREYKKQIKITPEAVVRLNITLERAEFNISELSANKESFNPRNPGLLGTIELTFEVTSWGEGNVKIYNEGGNLVFTKALSPFNTWHQIFRWNGKSTRGESLPDGLYKIVLTATSSKGKKTIKREKYIKIDSSLIISFRNLWNGSSGLMYAETTDILPPFDFQLSMLAVGHRENINGIEYFRFPSILSLRLGLGSQFELGVSGALIFENSDLTPFNLNLSLKRLLLQQRFFSALNLSMAGTLRLTYQEYTKTDIFSNPGGISLALPLSLSMGKLNLLYSPEGVISYYRVTYPYITPPVTTNSLPESWFYQRAGILLDFGFLTGGFSVSLRSAPLSYLSTNNFKLIEPPLQTAMEFNFMIPKTRVFLSLLTAAEIEDTDNYYVSAGAGINYLY